MLPGYDWCVACVAAKAVEGAITLGKPVGDDGPDEVRSGLSAEEEARALIEKRKRRE